MPTICDPAFTGIVKSIEPSLSAEFAAKWRSSLLFGYSPYVIARLLGASGAIAGAAQLVSAAVAVAAVAWAFRRIPAETRRLAVLLAAAVLFAPHVQTYDLVFLAVAVMLVFADRLPRGFRPGEVAVLMLLWIAPYFFPVHVGAGAVQFSGYLGMLTPLAALALILFTLAPMPGAVAPARTSGR